MSPRSLRGLLFQLAVTFCELLTIGPPPAVRLTWGGLRGVEIFEEPGRILISPAKEDPVRTGGNERDPILDMGEDPVDDKVTDASTNHDRYLYSGG